MRYLKYLAILGFFVLPVISYGAHVSIGIAVVPGYVYVPPPPVCPYGYYGYYPYACAPYGYYGPEFFVGGIFIGAGPWYHGYYGPEERFFPRGGYGYYGHPFHRQGGHGFVAGPGRGSFVGSFRRGHEGGGFHSGGRGRGFRGHGRW